MVGEVIGGKECLVRKWLICCYKSGMTNGLQCQCPFHWIGSSSLEGCVEDSEAFLGLIIVIRDVLG